MYMYIFDVENCTIKQKIKIGNFRYFVSLIKTKHLFLYLIFLLLFIKKKMIIRNIEKKLT